jgi:hypothetical protein
MINQIFSYVLENGNWKITQNSAKWDAKPLEIMKEVFPHIETTGWYKERNLAIDKDIDVVVEDGLVVNTEFSCQPKLNRNFIEKIKKSWSVDEASQRTKSAIKHLSQFIPVFSKASVGSKPLFGAQQIPDSDPTLRVAEVSFPTEKYARCKIVKVSSVLDIVDAIIEQFIKLRYIDTSAYKTRDLKHIENLKESDIKHYAGEFCKQGEYPILLANRNISK